MGLRKQILVSSHDDDDDELMIMLPCFFLFLGNPYINTYMDILITNSNNLEIEVFDLSRFESSQRP